MKLVEVVTPDEVSHRKGVEAGVVVSAPSSVVVETTGVDRLNYLLRCMQNFELFC